METIKINDIVKKDSGLVIIKYSPEDAAVGVKYEATMNTKWQAQDVDYIEKDVGVGGTVSVLIVPKGDYINITKVDMKSAVKGEQEVNEGAADTARILTEGKAGLMTPKDIMIISQCGMKAYGTGGDRSPQQLLDCYRFFVLELEQNG